MLNTRKRDCPVHGKSLWNKKLQSSAEKSEQPFKAKVSADKAQMCSKSCTPSAHYWERNEGDFGAFCCSVLRPQGMCCAETEQGQPHTSAHTSAHTPGHTPGHTSGHTSGHMCTQAHTDFQSQALTWAHGSGDEKHGFVDVPQNHIAMNPFWEERAVDADCTWTITEAWNSNFFSDRSITPEWNLLCWCILALLWDVSLGTHQQRIQPKEKFMESNYCFYLSSVKWGEERHLILIK